MEQKQMQRFLEFEDIVNIPLPPPCWHCSQTAPKLGEAKVLPACLCSLSA